MRDVKEMKSFNREQGKQRKTGGDYRNEVKIWKVWTNPARKV
jgi:hypothetical protein